MSTHKKLRYLIPPGTRFNFLAASRPISILSIVLLVASIAALFVNHEVRGAPLNFTIDFRGGTEMILEPRDDEGPRELPVAGVRDALQAAEHGDDEVSTMHWTEGGREVEGIVVRSTRFEAGLEREVAGILERAYPGVDLRVVQSYGVGPRASASLLRDGLKAIVYAMALIALYLAFRFDIRYAPGALKATLHDAVLVVGVLAVTWTPVSLATLAALLTVVGYSVNDTAIVFDRIRENLRVRKHEPLERIVNESLNQVLGRSLLTSLFVFVVTLAMSIFGDGVLAGFAFVLNVGIVIGAASTLFLAAPVFVWISRRWYARPPSRGITAASGQGEVKP